MKKLVLAIVVVAAMALAFGAQAEEKYVAGGFEASGHINTGFGFQAIGKNYLTNGANAALARDGWTNIQNVPTSNTGKLEDFGFLLDEVELDLTKTFGENIKFRTDIQFGDATLGSTTAGVGIEQAYVTANIAVGNGVELLAGRFDAPIGFESADRNDNDTISRSAIFNYGLHPRTLTGLKLYYAFSDAFDWHFYVVNNLEDGMAVNFNGDTNIIPSAGTRVGYTWGEEGTESTVGLSVAAGPEAPRATKKTGRWSYLADLDWNVWFTEAFALGGEGIYRMDNAATGAPDAKYLAGILNLHYVFSDVWDGTLKYALLKQNSYDGITTAAALAGTYAPQVAGKAWMHEIGAAGGYQITDGAKFVAEYRLDWTDYKQAAFTGKNYSHAFLGNFAYTF